MPEKRQTRVPVEERVRRYLALMPPAISGSGGHTALFNVVRTLLHGFGLSIESARPFLDDYNLRCTPPWSESEINHKLRSVDGLPSPEGRGYLLGDIGVAPTGSLRRSMGLKTEQERRQQVEFDPQKLAEIAAPWAPVADLVWLANRSAVDPAVCGAGDFLRALYAPGEQVLVFTDEMSQGDALWPKDELPTGGKCGVWFLPQPVDGQFHPNPRSTDKQGNPRLSRRSEESVRTFRYLLLESDKAAPRDWLGFIVQAPLKIEALYTSGSRSVHALVRVDCRTKAEWDAEKKALMPFLLVGQMLGADRGTWSAVRLSRLPGCVRAGKQGRDRTYTRFPEPRLQKLLYLKPGADGRPICELPAQRDVAPHWLAQADRVLDGYEPEVPLEQLRAALGYYAPVSGAGAPFRTALENLSEIKTSTQNDHG